MDISYYAKGLIIGISIAAPVGPIGALCIQRTLVQGRVVGLVSGLGAATADAAYGILAISGLTIVTNFLIGQQYWIQLVGGVFLCYLGVKIITSNTIYSPVKDCKKSNKSAFLSVFFLTLTNPVTILAFVAIFAGLGIADSQHHPFSAILLVMGVFCGSALWWVILSFAVGLLKSRVNTKFLTMINQVSGVIILLFGAFALYGLL